MTNVRPKTRQASTQCMSRHVEYRCSLGCPIIKVKRLISSSNLNPRPYPSPKVLHQLVERTSKTHSRSRRYPRHWSGKFRECPLFELCSAAFSTRRDRHMSSPKNGRRLKWSSFDSLKLLCKIYKLHLTAWKCFGNLINCIFDTAEAGWGVHSAITNNYFCRKPRAKWAWLLCISCRFWPSDARWDSRIELK